MISESSLVGRLRARLPAIGDDAAVVETPPGVIVMCADASVAGVHADLALVGVDDFGWKALVTALSDVAAMGARPCYALVTVSGPLASIDFDRLYDGLLAAASAYGCQVVGGDLTGGSELVVSVAVVGAVEDTPGSPVRRSGAGAGDVLFVTGPLGAAAGGLMVRRKGLSGEAPDLALAHRRPRPRLAEGETARRAGATAMIDISDGLASELVHLSEESGVGVAVHRVPVAVGLARYCDDPEAVALGGGEDYELLFAAPDAAAVEEAFAAAGLVAPLRIGVCTGDPGERRLRDGPLPEVGWEHTW